MPIPYVCLLRGYSQTYRLIPIAIYTASKNVAPDDVRKSPKHVEHLMINKDTLKEFVHLVGVLIYINHEDIRLPQTEPKLDARARCS